MASIETRVVLPLLMLPPWEEVVLVFALGCSFGVLYGAMRRESEGSISAWCWLGLIVLGTVGMETVGRVTELTHLAEVAILLATRQSRQQGS